MYSIKYAGVVDGAMGILSRKVALEPHTAGSRPTPIYVYKQYANIALCCSRTRHRRCQTRPGRNELFDQQLSANSRQEWTEEETAAADFGLWDHAAGLTMKQQETVEAYNGGYPAARRQKMTQKLSRTSFLTREDLSRTAILDGEMTTPEVRFRCPKPTGPILISVSKKPRAKTQGNFRPGNRRGQSHDFGSENTWQAPSSEFMGGKPSERATGIPDPERYNVHMITKYLCAKRMQYTHKKPRPKPTMEFPSRVPPMSKGFRGSVIKALSINRVQSRRADAQKENADSEDETVASQVGKVKSWELFQRTVFRNRRIKLQSRQLLAEKLNTQRSDWAGTVPRRREAPYCPMLFAEAKRICSTEGECRSKSAAEVTATLRNGLSVLLKRRAERVVLPEGTPLEGNVFADSPESSAKLTKRSVMSRTNTVHIQQASCGV